MLTAAVMLSYQTAGKAARDAVFLGNFPAAKLPTMVMTAALLAVALGLIFGKWLERRGPGYVVPRAFLVSGVLQLIEWAFYDSNPQVVAPLVYLHIVGLGAILLSGFWSFASEQLNPREAKQTFGKIAGMGTLGGIAGGLIAERTGAFFGTSAVLGQLGVSHLVCAAVLFRAARLPGVVNPKQKDDGVSALQTFSRIPYLAGLAVLILLGTSNAAVIDYLFKAQAAETIGKGPGLLRFFALFHTGSAIITFIFQTFLSRLSFEKLGLTKTVGSLPAITGAGSLVALAFPFFPVTALTRVMELVVRGSIFRSGYELFYIPIPAREKRTVKSLIDVACDRMGDAVGSAIVQTAMIAAPGAVRNVVLGITAISAGVSLWIASRLDKAYQGVVKHGLLDRADELDLGYVEDVTTLSSVMHTVSSFTPVRPAGMPATQKKEKEEPLPTTIEMDGVIEKLVELRSGDARRVLNALRRIKSLDALITPQVVSLLAWDEVSADARKLLHRDADRHVGLLVDFLLDEEVDFTIRRRLPRVLALTLSQRALDGLMEGLSDKRFEVRFQCGRALGYLHNQAPGLHLDTERVFGAVDNEVSVNRTIWDGRRLLEERDPQDEFSFLDEVIRERAHHSLEHVFSLLSILYPAEPLRVAFRALHSGDTSLRALALEYLEGILPDRTRDKLWTVLDGSTAPAAPEGARKEALRKLMASNDRLVLEWKDKAQ